MGWSNQVDKICCAQVFSDHGILVATRLLVQASSFDDDLLYLIEGESAKYYIWKLALNGVFEILKDSSRHILSSRFDLEY